MSPSIFIQDASGQLMPLAPAEYEAEKVLQELLAENPALLVSQADGAARRYLLIRREFGVPGEEGGSHRWSLDHLFLDDEGVPTLVEVKRSSDSRIRREVVGQMLDYAANGVLYWPLDSLVEEFKSTCVSRGADPEEILGAHLEGSGLEPEEFWDRVSTNLKAKRIRLLFVADEIPQELRTIVEFLNEQMRDADVLAIEVKRYGSEGGPRTFVADVIGNTATAMVGKDRNQTIGPKGKLYQEFWPPVMQALREREPTWGSTTKRVPNWYSFDLPSGRSGIWYNLQFTQTRRLRVTLFVTRHVTGVGDRAFELLQEHRSEIESRFGGPLAWTTVEGRERADIEAVRNGEASVDRVEDWPEYREWLIETAIRFHKAIQPAIEALPTVAQPAGA